MKQAVKSRGRGQLFAGNSTARLLVSNGSLLLAGVLVSVAADWPAYRNANGDGISLESTTAPWPTGGPKRLWKVETPGGFSSFAVAASRAFAVLSRGQGSNNLETVVAWDANTGQELWAASTDPAQYPGGGDSGAPNNRGGDGPRSTPALDGNRVYFYSSVLGLHCLDAATGKPVWKRDILTEHAGRNISWKSALSPVIDGELVFVAGGGAGQSMLAFHKETGALAWKSGDEKLTHATPVVATLHGVRQVIFMMQSGLVAVGASDGRPLWKFSHPYRTSTACSPVVSGDVVFCTAGYEVGGAACQVTKTGDAFAARELWRHKGNAVAASLWSPPVVKDAFLYGMISFKDFGDGPLKCLDLKTGEVKWQQPGFGNGNVILAGKHLIALTDDGHVVLVEATPDAFKEVSRFKAVSGKCWSTPALANGRLYVRSTKEGACFDLTAAAR
jgi:outer membrane protein assembly factor BamB